MAASESEAAGMDSNVTVFIEDLLQQTLAGNKSLNATLAAIQTLLVQAARGPPISRGSSEPCTTALPAAHWQDHGHDYSYYYDSNHSSNVSATCQNPAQVLDHEPWNIVLITYCVVAVVGIFCEILLHTAKHHLHHKEKAMALLNAVLNELTVMGIIGFVTYVINTDCILKVPDDYKEVFEVIHMLIFIIVVVYILLSLILTGLLYMSLATYRNFENMAALDIATLLTDTTLESKHATPVIASPNPSRHHWKRMAVSCCCSLSMCNLVVWGWCCRKNYRLGQRSFGGGCRQGCCSGCGNSRRPRTTSAVGRVCVQNLQVPFEYHAHRLALLNRWSIPRERVLLSSSHVGFDFTVYVVPGGGCSSHHAAPAVSPHTRVDCRCFHACLLTYVSRWTC